MVNPPDNDRPGRSAPTPAVGDLIDGKFRLIAALGAGAMGTVYKAVQQVIEREVAVKFLHRHLAANEDSIARFQREAQLACKLRHPHTVLIFDFGVWEGLPYLVMELADGKSLRELFTPDFRFTPAQARSFIEQVGGALAEAHSLGIVHRDLKPENITVTEDSSRNMQFRVLDFGLAKSITAVPGAENATRYGMFFGTPAYSSPEQAMVKPVGSASDLYSLAIVLYEGLTGEVPFRADSDMELLMKHVQEPVPSLKRQIKPLGLDPEFAALIERCLAKDPKDRFPSARELLAALPAIKPTTQAAPPVELRHALVGAGVIALAAFGIWAMIPDRGDKEIARNPDPIGIQATIAAPTAAADFSSVPLSPSSSQIPSSSSAPSYSSSASAAQSETAFLFPTVAAIFTTPPIAPIPTSMPWDPFHTSSIAVPTPISPFPTVYGRYTQRGYSPKESEFPQQHAAGSEAGLSAFSAGRFSDAIRLLEPVARDNPRDVSALTALGLSYEHLNRCQDAITPLAMAISVTPDKGVLYYYLGRVQAQCNQPQDALTSLNRAIQLDKTLRSRAAKDQLFDTVINSPEFQALIRPTGRRGSRISDIGRSVGETISNLWYGISR